MNATVNEVEQLAQDAVKSANRPTQNMLRWLALIVLSSAGGGSAWLYTTDERMTLAAEKMTNAAASAAVHEERQDSKMSNNAQAIDSNRNAISGNTEEIKRNGKSIRDIGVLLVQQGRHVEDMVRAVAGGQPVPNRPMGLDDIERKILSAGGQ